MADILILLGRVRKEMDTEEGSSRVWMEEAVDRAFADADRALGRLAV